MKNKTGIFCMILGAVLILGAAALAFRNQKEDDTAQKAVVEIVPQLVQQIQDNTRAENVDPEVEVLPELELQKPVELLTEEDKKMTEVEINGNLYIGYLSIPALNLELPIMSTWSYPQLQIAPCRYHGSIRGEDLVLMAHNYKSHFGTISNLTLGDEVIFTDMDGKVTRYVVVGKDVLDPSAVEVMTAGEYDLTLFTCTYGGASRVTVYCDVVK
jgi:sortase A